MSFGMESNSNKSPEVTESSSYECVTDSFSNVSDSVKPADFTQTSEIGNTKTQDFRNWINPENYDASGKYSGDYKPGGMDAVDFAQEIKDQSKEAYAGYLQRRTDIPRDEKNDLYADYTSRLKELQEEYKEDLQLEKTEQSILAEKSYIKYEQLEKQHALYREIQEEPKEVFISPDDIYEVGYDEEIPDFWSERETPIEESMRVAAKIPEVRKLLEEGKSIDELRNDEELAVCIDAYFSEDNPIEVTQYENAYIYEAGVRDRIKAAKAVGCDIPVMVISEAREIAEVKQEIIDEFEEMGITYEGVDDLTIEQSREIKAAIAEMRENYPEIKDLIARVEVVERLDKDAIAAAGPVLIENRVAARVQISQKEFSEHLEERLEIYREKGFFAGTGTQGVIKHEMGHVLQLKLDAESVGLEDDSQITGKYNRGRYNDMIDKWSSNENTDVILDNALRNLSLSRQDVSRELSKYGATNSAEALAEAASEVNTSPNPRRLAVEIMKEYEKMKKEREGKLC